MVSSLVITLREGLEAALIVGILLAYLAKTGRRDRAPGVWLGTGLALLVSLAVGAAIYFTLGEFEGTAEQLFEGSAMLLAVGVLTYMVYWMRRQASDLRSSLQRQVASALGGTRVALASLAFLVVVREGLELALFLFGSAQTSTPAATLVGGLLGLALAVVLGYGVYRGGLRIDFRAFFGVTGVLLVFFAAGMLAHGIHEYVEAGLLPGIVLPVWDLGPVLPESSLLGQFLKALFGYSDDPSLLEVGVYVVYVVGLLWPYWRPLGARTRQAAGRSV
jgi:high-affinity iron transporter